MGEEIITYTLDDADNQVVSDFIERNSLSMTREIRLDLDNLIHEIANEAYAKGRKRAK